YSPAYKLAYAELEKRLTEYNLQSNKEAVEEYAREIARQVFETTESKLRGGTWQFVDGDITRIHQPKPRDEQPRTTEAMAVLAETAKFKVKNFVRKLATRHRLGDFGRGSKSDDEDAEFVVAFEPVCGNLALNDEVFQREEIDRVRKALAKLDSTRQEIVWLRYLEELTFREIGEQLGISVSTVRDRYRRALNELRAILTD
ncbi:MAG: sigma-70 family RNA polymerase sigma factor, partial [Planctomycetia bacterium]|nr:sigma-70 family RNA polymerase sigma factor [Planctomycetia bacterium]